MSLAGLVISGIGASALAQDRPSNDSGITSIEMEEFVVTARRREENLQEVPVTVTAINAENLKNRSAELLGDIAKETPSLTVQARVSDRNTQVVSLRGQVQTDSASTLDPSVGVYLNDVYVARNNGANFELFDVDRVEVLAGPQGTLYGRNTTGGAIKVVTAAADPDAGVTGYGLVNGGNFDARRVEGAINLPVNDRFALRLAGINIQRDGYGKTIVGNLTPRPNQLIPNGPVVFDAATPFTARKTFDTDDKDIKAGRFSGFFEATDKLSFSFVGDYSKQATNGATGYNVGSNTFLALPPAEDAQLPSVFFPGTNLPVKPFGNLTKCSSDFYTTCQDSAPKSTAEIYGVGLTTAYATDAGTAKLIYGYRDVESFFRSDLEGSPIPFVTVEQPTKVHQNTVEAQFQGQAASVDYTIGLYYFNEIGTEGFTDTSSVVAPTDTARRRMKGDIDNESKSVYGQVGYGLTDSIRLTAGARYTRDDKSLVSTAALLPSADFPQGACIFTQSGFAPNPTASNCRFSKDKSFDHVSWTVGLDWQIQENYLVYLKSSEGYRSGGLNLRGLDPATQKPFKEETIRDIEFGLKSRPFERLQLNLTYYHSDYQDIQTTQFLFNQFPQNTTTFVLNQGKADIDGVELQSTILATKNLSFDLTGSYNNFSFDDRRFVPPLTPRYKGSAAVNVLLPTNLGDWTARASYSYQDEFFTTNQRAEAQFKQATIGSRGLVDARISLNLKQYETTISLFGTNLTNKEYFESGTVFSLALPVPNAPLLDVFNRLQVGAPRLYGLEIRKQF
jgi:iron complex outermembrane receptor protein